MNKVSDFKRKLVFILICIFFSNNSLSQNCELIAINRDDLIIKEIIDSVKNRFSECPSIRGFFFYYSKSVNGNNKFNLLVDIGNGKFNEINVQNNFQFDLLGYINTDSLYLNELTQGYFYSMCRNVHSSSTVEIFGFISNDIEFVIDSLKGDLDFLVKEKFQDDSIGLIFKHLKVMGR